jgi:hypothetical protein
MITFTAAFGIPDLVHGIKKGNKKKKKREGGLRGRGKTRIFTSL